MPDDRQSKPGSPTDAGDVQSPEALFTSQLELIRRIVRHVAGRHMLRPQDRDDFEAEVYVKLIDDEYAVLRRFKGRSSLATYLVTVIQRVCLDFQIERWGKWRPSAAARDLGPVAVELERLMHHEGRKFDDACAVLASAPVPVDRERLASLLNKLPERPSRRTDGPEGLENAPVPDGQADAVLLDREQRETARRARAALAEALDLLPPQDRLLVRLAYSEGLTIADIALTLGLKQRPLYRALDRCLG